MTKNAFFGRGPYLDTLRKRIAGLKHGYRQNMAIIGDELVGKSSIIYELLNHFSDNHVITLYLETRPERLDSFCKRFIGTLLYNFLINSARPLKEDLAFLINKSSGHIPKTTEKIKAILANIEKRKKINIFPELLSLCETINQETGKFCVVFFDEFHNLENLGIKGIYAEWSKLLIQQKNTMYVIVSSMKFKAKNILSKDLSLLFGNFETIAVEPFDITASEEYLSRRLEGTEINAGLKNFIVHFTGGYPFYLELITAELLKSGVGGLSLADILEGLLFAPAGILNQKFSNYLKRFLDSPYSQEYISILHLVSCGQNRLKDISHILHKPKQELNLRVSHLLECDTVSRSGEFLKINDRVLGFWMKFVYKEKMNSLTFDAENQKLLFRQNLEAMIQEFLSSAKQPFVERMAELLRLFDDDTVQIERKRLKLMHFREIKTVHFNHSGFKDGLIGRSHEGVWIMAFKNEPLIEEDIVEFAKECKKYRHKLQRKIIIAFRDIEANAKLKAMEEKIWTWDLNNLNHVLDLFSRPRVIA